MARDFVESAGLNQDLSIAEKMPATKSCPTAFAVRQHLGWRLRRISREQGLTLPMAKARGFSAQPPLPAPARAYTMSPSV